jgi:carboxymethylenebutenolidase
MIIHDQEYADVETPSGPMRLHVFRPRTDEHGQRTAGARAPAPSRWPAILFYSEIFQVTAPIRRAAAMLAGRGYLVAVPEIYHEALEPGCVLAYDDAGKERGNELKYAKSVAAFDADARAALDWIAASPHAGGAIVTMGVCLGGHLALRAAFDPRVRAAACFYPTDLHSRTLGLGRRDDTLDRLTDVRGELLFVFGRQDPHVPLAGRRTIHEALEAAGTSFTWHEFNAAHAFLRDEGARYDPALARLAWELVAELCERRQR